VSLVRYDDGSLLDAARVADACHRQGALLRWTPASAAAQSLGCDRLGADFMVSAGTSGCWGVWDGFFWVKSEHLGWCGRDRFIGWRWKARTISRPLNFEDPKPAASATRWIHRSGQLFHFNLAAMDVSVDFVVRMGPERVAAHNRKLIELMFERLPKETALSRRVAGCGGGAAVGA